MAIVRARANNPPLIIRDEPTVLAIQDGLIEATTLEAAARHCTGEMQALKLSAL